MDQGRDPVTGTPTNPPVDSTRTSDNPQAIADDIRETRAELDETIGAIGAKLDPSHLIDEAKDHLTASARDAGASMLDQVKSSSVLDTIKDNPVPAMAVGLSVAWFLSKIGESETDRYRRERYLATGDPYYAPRLQGRYGEDRYGRGYDRGYGRAYSGDAYGDDESMLDTAKDKATDAVDAAKDKASHAADAVKDAASTLGDKASSATDRAGSATSDASGAVGDRARGAGRQLQRYERRAESWLDRQMQQNPLAVGAVALAAGALVGLSVPETDAEHRALGDPAEAARQRLTSAARDAGERVTSAAQDVADQAADKAKAVGKEAESEAKEVGDKAQSRADRVSDTAKAEADRKTPGSSTSSGSDASTGSSVDLSTSSGGPGTTKPPSTSDLPDTVVDMSGTSGSSGTGSAGTS